MHITEGMLPVKWAVTWYGVSALCVAKGLRDLNIKVKTVPAIKQMLGLLGAAVFIISLLPIPVPIAGTSAHPTGTPLAAILVGPFLSSILATVALLLQALFFAHGGLTTLGANVLSEGIVGSLVGYLVFRGLRRLGAGLGLAAGIAALLGNLSVYMATATELALALHGNQPVWSITWKFMLAFLPAQGPLAVLEALVTGGIIRYINIQRPDILRHLGVVNEPSPSSDVNFRGDNNVYRG